LLIRKDPTNLDFDVKECINLSNTVLLVGSTIVALIMATTMIIIRARVARKPTSAKKIILPPLFMSTGALMFIFPFFRVESIQILEALVVGIIFSIFLIKSTKFEIKNDEIYLIPSKLFIFILFGLLIIRLIVKLIIGSTISFGETSGLFYLIALGMMITWRIAMFIKYNQLKSELTLKTTRQLN